MDRNRSELAERITKLGAMLEHSSAKNKRGRRGEYRWGQDRVLAFLKLRAEISSTDLAYLMGVPPAMLRSVLDKMAEQGLVTLTPTEGEAVIVKLADTKESEPEEPMFSFLSDEEADMLLGYVDKMISSLDDEKDSENTSQDDFEVRLNWKVRPRHHGDSREQAWHGRDFEFRGKLPRIRPPFFYGW